MVEFRGIEASSSCRILHHLLRLLHVASLHGVKVFLVLLGSDAEAHIPFRLVPFVKVALDVVDHAIRPCAVILRIVVGIVSSEVDVRLATSALHDPADDGELFVSRLHGEVDGAGISVDSNRTTIDEVNHVGLYAGRRVAVLLVVEVGDVAMVYGSSSVQEGAVALHHVPTAEVQQSAVREDVSCLAEILRGAEALLGLVEEFLVGDAESRLASLLLLCVLADTGKNVGENLLAGLDSAVEAQLADDLLVHCVEVSVEFLLLTGNILVEDLLVECVIELRNDRHLRKILAVLVEHLEVEQQLVVSRCVHILAILAVKELLEARN